MIDLILSSFTALLMLIALPLAFALGYLLLLTLAAACGRRELPQAPRQHRFRIIVPAHNEELVIAPVLRRLMALDYERTHFDVIVVADNCTDQTAAVARSCGARVLERHDHTARGKGHALAYVFAALRDETFDAYVILDADTIAAPDLLHVLNRYLAAGNRVVQAHYDVLDPWASSRTALMYIALRIFHYVRPLGRRALGLSATLTGNGMCFAREIIEQHPWDAFSLTEDLEYTGRLISSGERIVFAPEAHIWAQMPVARTQATSQRMRWEAGRLAIARREGLRSLWHGLRRADGRVFDWGMDLLIPPLAALALLIMAGTALALVIVLLGGTVLLLWLWLSLCAALIMFVGAALIVGRLPVRAYRAIFYAPGYVLWKLWIYVIMALRRGPQSWIRTERVRMDESA